MKGTNHLQEIIDRTSLAFLYPFSLTMNRLLTRRLIGCDVANVKKIDYFYTLTSISLSFYSISHTLRRANFSFLRSLFHLKYIFQKLSYTSVLVRSASGLHVCIKIPSYDGTDRSQEIKD